MFGNCRRNCSITKLQEAQGGRSVNKLTMPATYDALDLIKSQVEAFGYNSKEIPVAVPEFGKPATLDLTEVAKQRTSNSRSS